MVASTAEDPADVAVEGDGKLVDGSPIHHCPCWDRMAERKNVRLL